MSQRIIFETIQSIDGGATYTELKKEIENKYPKRTLDEYLGLRLSALVQKNAILENTRNGKTIYKINSDYSPDDFGISLLNFDEDIDMADFQSRGIDITNIVGTGTFCDSIDLQKLGIGFKSIEYEPETSSLAIWRPFNDKSVTGLITATGKITLVGSKNRSDIIKTIDHLYDRMASFVEEIVKKDTFIAEFQINNIAASASLNRELELSEVAVGLGLEDTEYDPKGFPGIIYRPIPGVVTLIFRSGSVIITGNSYSNILEGWDKMYRDLQEIGVEIDI